jgi:EAL domain-containing protein (putative c-di-GMP-specific phosphodiesterase class I)
MEEKGRKLKVAMVLEPIVDLKTQQLFGYRVLSRIGAYYGHGYFFGYETYNIPLE